MNQEDQQAQEFAQGRALGRQTAIADQRAGSYDETRAADRYREVNGIPRGLDLHADFAFARAGFIQGYQLGGTDLRDAWFSI